MGWIGKQEFDLFMNVSSSEWLPVSIMEAFSFVIPALVTAVGGNPEIVQEGAGILLDENPSINSITQNIENWDVSKVTSMEGMFRSTAAFNCGDVNNMNTKS